MTALCWLCVLALPACGGGAPTGASGPPPAAPLVSPGIWAVLGSSTAAGVGAGPGQGWVALLTATFTPRQVVLQNLARSGTLTFHVQATGTVPPPGQPGPDTEINIDRALAAAPRLLLLSFPTNDTAAGIASTQTVANLTALRERARAQVPAVAVMLLSTQPRDGFTAAQRATLDEIDRLAAIEFGPCFVPLRAALSDAAGQIAAVYAAGDGIHLNDAGHRVVHDRVAARLAAGDCVRLGG